MENARLDAVLADTGCFATSIMKQGGVLIPRKHPLVRTAYELNDEPSAYGDHGIRIYGIWSPIVEGRICTHAIKWKMARKAIDVQEAIADQGARAPWTCGNNCLPVEKTYQTGGELPGSEEPAALADFENMSKKELRELTARLRLVKPKRRKGHKQEITEHQWLQLDAELLSRGFDASETEVDLLLRGGSLPSGAGLRLFYRNQRLQEDDKWRQWY